MRVYFDDCGRCDIEAVGAVEILVLVIYGKGVVLVVLCVSAYHNALSCWQLNTLLAQALGKVYGLAIGCYRSDETVGLNSICIFNPEIVGHVLRVCCLNIQNAIAVAIEVYSIGVVINGYWGIVESYGVERCAIISGRYIKRVLQLWIVFHNLLVLSKSDVRIGTAALYLNLVGMVALHYYRCCTELLLCRCSYSPGSSIVGRAWINVTFTKGVYILFVAVGFCYGSQQCVIDSLDVNRRIITVLCRLKLYFVVARNHCLSNIINLNRHFVRIIDV